MAGARGEDRDIPLTRSVLFIALTRTAAAFLLNPLQLLPIEGHEGRSWFYMQHLSIRSPTLAGGRHPAAQLGTAGKKTRGHRKGHLHDGVLVG